ncbi:hypothetical protein NOS3756_38650 [Nostoc sp. NIES-3756]|uniref:DUF2795 domain-containing protein n=1 Tax=Nostoc sp. NIES-3756 TaxID=1751286 RepID=UPI0007201D88|nr:DUF2795 domain-containing protein [Nostoc sp. NIES-3756]BAT54890.1 hypothetical protein NOS3756_38650 [Nostoc sp. NIES-3756]BAY37345.1 hypothetical protein NIES2111_16820 [Nostoc sp. NIES-2111]
MFNISLNQLQNNLKTLSYPLSKKSLIKYAEEKGVDEQVLRFLKLLPSRQYESLGDVSNYIDELTITKVNPAQLRKNLKQVNYPLSKKDLIKYAEEKGVDEHILRALRCLPSKQYQTVDEVNEAINA